MPSCDEYTSFAADCVSKISAGAAVKRHHVRTPNGSLKIMSSNSHMGNFESSAISSIRVAFQRSAGRFCKSSSTSTPAVALHNSAGAILPSAFPNKHAVGCHSGSESNLPVAMG